MKAILYSAFPGTGKTHLFQNQSDLKVLDSDSSKFDKSEFPGNYIKHIQNHLGKADVICISSHKEVRDALVAQNMIFSLVYPHVRLKDEYLQRFRGRGDVDGFIKLIASNWNNWLLELRNQKHCKHIVLKSGEFLSEKICELKQERDRISFMACGFSNEESTFILDVVHKRNPRIALLQIAMMGEIKRKELSQLKAAYPHIADKIYRIATIEAKPFILAFCKLLAATPQKELF